MNCAICGKTTMLGYHGEQVPIRDAHALAQHKRLEHPAAYQVTIAARRTKAWTTKLAKVAEIQRVYDARLAASRPVVYSYNGVTTTCPSSDVMRWHIFSGGATQTDVRFPDAAAFRLYEEIKEEIAKLEADARGHLTCAWEMGTPVTLEHLDELDRAAAE